MLAFRSCKHQCPDEIDPSFDNLYATGGFATDRSIQKMPTESAQLYMNSGGCNPRQDGLDHDKLSTSV